MLDQSAGPSGHGRRSLEWVALDDPEHHVIARFTLEALAQLVGTSPEALIHAHRRGEGALPLVLQVEELDALADIGGVVQLTPPTGERIVVARIGRSSLVAFARPDDGAVEALEVVVKEAG
jgi:hypothetical protein